MSLADGAFFTFIANRRTRVTVVCLGSGSTAPTGDIATLRRATGVSGATARVRAGCLARYRSTVGAGGCRGTGALLGCAGFTAEEVVCRLGGERLRFRRGRCEGGICGILNRRGRRVGLLGESRQYPRKCDQQSAGNECVQPIVTLSSFHRGLLSSTCRSFGSSEAAIAPTADAIRSTKTDQQSEGESRGLVRGGKG